MMKTLRFLLPAMAVPALALVLTACSDDDKNEPLPELAESTVYTGKTLDLEYEDAAMAGKSARIYRQGNSYMLNLYSAINPGDISPSLSQLPIVDGPGVLPGSPKLTIPINIHKDHDEYEFKGKSNTDFCSYEYSGDIKNGVLELDIDDVVLKNSRLSNTAWVPAPLKSNDDGLTYVSSPLYINWQSSAPVEVDNVKLEPGEILNIISTLPIIPVYNGTARISIAELITQELVSVGFRNDGLFNVNYVNASNGADHLASLPQNMIQYVVADNSFLKIYPNPIDVYSQILLARSTRSVTLDNLISLVNNFLPMMSEGIPMQYNLSQTGLRVFLNTQTLRPVVSGILIPLLTDPDIIQNIERAISSDPTLAKFAPVIKNAINTLPYLIEKTTTMELGLNFVPYPR